jgi:hypothetical protein
MKLIISIAFLAISMSASSVSGSRIPSSGTASGRASLSLTEDKKHRLYTAALAASESPLDSDTFKDVCRESGIFDASGTPNDQYMAFVSQHVNWGIKSETEQFRREINSRDKAREYIREHLFAR